MAVAAVKEDEHSTIRFKRPKTSPSPRTSLASVESLTVPLVQEVVLLADFQCAECQGRVADIISRMNGETESVVVSVLDKKVTLTCRYQDVLEVPGRQFVATYRKPPSKVAMFRRLFRLYRSS